MFNTLASFRPEHIPEHCKPRNLVIERKNVFKPKDLFSEWNNYDEDATAGRCYEIDSKFFRLSHLCEFDENDIEKSKIVIA